MKNAETLAGVERERERERESSNLENEKKFVYTRITDKNRFDEKS